MAHLPASLCWGKNETKLRFDPARPLDLRSKLDEKFGSILEGKLFTHPVYLCPGAWYGCIPFVVLCCRAGRGKPEGQQFTPRIPYHGSNNTPALTMPRAHFIVLRCNVPDFLFWYFFLFPSRSGKQTLNCFRLRASFKTADCIHNHDDNVSFLPLGKTPPSGKIFRVEKISAKGSIRLPCSRSLDQCRKVQISPHRFLVQCFGASIHGASSDLGNCFTTQWHLKLLLRGKSGPSWQDGPASRMVSIFEAARSQVTGCSVRFCATFCSGFL